MGDYTLQGKLKSGVVMDRDENSEFACSLAGDEVDESFVRLGFGRIGDRIGSRDEYAPRQLNETVEVKVFWMNIEKGGGME
jgi:hypothetical protein